MVLLRSGIVVLLAAPVTCLAHHSVSAWFDTSEVIELEGVVTEVEWSNPHVRFTLSVEDENGQTVDWDVESLSVSGIGRWGITADLMAVGDRVLVAGNPSRRSLDNVFVRNILLPSGQEIVLGGDARFSDRAIHGGELLEVEEGDASRPDLGIFRVWSTGAGANFPFPEELDPDFDFGAYPLTETAKAALAAFNYETDDPLRNCATKGFPTIMEQPYPMEVVQQDEDTILMHLEEYDTQRTIHMQPDPNAPKPEPSLLGYSVGRWDGRDLVVTTTQSSWGHFDSVGVPLSGDAVFVERFMPSERGDRMDYSMTVTDSSTFSEPVEVTKHWIWRPEMSVGRFECTPDR
jgi:Family of unknown function (DUF6152)